MAYAAALAVAVLLFFAVNVHGTKKDGIPAVDGIYNGRFGLDGVSIDGQAVFNGRGGVTGDVSFSQEAPGKPIQIHLNLGGLSQSSDSYRWSIHEFPIRSSLCNDFPCSNENVGEVFNPNSRNATCDNTEAAPCRAGDLTSKLGPLRNDRPWQTFEDSKLSVSGYDSVIGRTLVIDREDGPEGAFICANIEQLGARLEILRASFENDFIQGDVIIRYATGRDDSTVEVDLYRSSNVSSGQATVTLNHGSAGPGNSCVEDEDNTVFGSEEYVESDYACDSQNSQRECPAGEISRKCGPLQFDGNRAHQFCTDNQIGSTPRTYLVDDNFALMVVISDENNNPLGCANLEMVAVQTGRAQFRSNTAFGDFLFWQNGPDDRTFVRAHLTGISEDRTLRIYSGAVGISNQCDPDVLGEVYCKPGNNVALPGSTATIGNLDSLLPLEAGQTSLRTTVSSSSLPLFGPYSILGRTLALVRESTNEIVACSTIMRQAAYPTGEVASILGYQNLNNPSIPPIPIGSD